VAARKGCLVQRSDRSARPFHEFAPLIDGASTLDRNGKVGAGVSRVNRAERALVGREMARKRVARAGP
jgi:uncharacterized protein (UPF0548 family)